MLAAMAAHAVLAIARTWPKTWRGKVNSPRHIVVLGEIDLSGLVTYQYKQFSITFSLYVCENF